MSSVSSICLITATQTQVSEFEDTLIRKFRNKSNWSPKKQNAQVETYIRTVITEFQKLKLRNPPKTNLTPEEKQRLNLLQNNQHIVVKPADKGSAIVIMNRTDYITEATRQLSDTKFYTKTQVDLTGTHINKITQTLSTMLRNDEIAQSVYRNLVPKDCKTPAFYFLPKIHKQNITGRPIISGNNSPTEKISAFVDEHIKQFVPRIKSYVRDTLDIKKIENFKLNGDYFLVTMDVTSLYTNIPNHEGLVAVTQTLICENAQFRANNRSLITLLQHVLHMNNFQFNGKLPANWGYGHGHTRGSLICKPIHGTIWRKTPRWQRIYTPVISSLHRRYIPHLPIQWARPHQIHDIHE